jgi:hypothetical protein
VKLRHTLADRAMFSDESLADLIETIEPRHMDISTMGDDVSTWGHCDRAGLSSAQVLEAVRGGRIWINMMAIEKVDPRFAEVLEGMYAEIEAVVPDFKTFKRKLGLLISSPGAKVFYHFDVPGQGLCRSGAGSGSGSRGTTSTPRPTTWSPATCCTGHSTARTGWRTTTFETSR